MEESASKRLRNIKHKVGSACVIQASERIEEATERKIDKK